MTNAVSLYFCIRTPHLPPIAALVCCRTDEELNEVLVPELSHKFTACADGFTVCGLCAIVFVC